MIMMKLKENFLIESREHLRDYLFMLIRLKRFDVSKNILLFGFT